MRAGIFSPQSPFKTVEEYTEWWLEEKGLISLSKEAMEMDEAFWKLCEVPLEKAKNIRVDIISVVDSEINEDWWENTADTDQFLVTGRVREVNWETTLYLQGNGWLEKV